MSYNIRDIREISNDPLTKFTNQLSKKLARFLNKQETDKLENKEDIYSNGQDVDTVLRFNNLNSTKFFDFATQYFPPTEPDNNNVRIWIQGRTIGEQITDLSGKGNHAFVFGDPVIVDGAPFDYGIHTGGTKSKAIRFNRPTSDQEGTEDMYIHHATLMRASEALSTGISFFIRFRVFDLSQQGGSNITLFEKIDNDPITDGVKVEIDTTGKLRFLLENTNVQYRQETASGTITTNTVYECWFTYAKSGNVQHIYVNGVDKSLTVGGPTSFHDDTTDKTLTIFSRGNMPDSHLYGDLYDFMMYREKVVSQTEVTHHYTNKWTIADIPFGQVMITNYWATYNEALSAGDFLTDSFMSDSFVI